jgi:hypothetical protein
MQVGAGARMIFTRLVALLPTLVLAVLFQRTNTFDTVGAGF